MGDGGVNTSDGGGDGCGVDVVTVRVIFVVFGFSVFR